MSPELPRQTSHELFLRWDFLDLVIYDGKRIEVRRATPEVLAIQQNDSLWLRDRSRSVYTDVLGTSSYEDIRQLIDTEDSHLIYPGKNRAQLHSLSARYFGKNRVVAIHFEPQL